MRKFFILTIVLLTLSFGLYANEPKVDKPDLNVSEGQNSNAPDSNIPDANVSGSKIPASNEQNSNEPDSNELDLNKPNLNNLDSNISPTIPYTNEPDSPEINNLELENYDSFSLPMTASFKEKTAKTGDQVNLKLAFKLDSKVDLPKELSIEGLDNFTIIKTEKTSNGVNIKLIVDALDTFEIPKLKLYIPDENGDLLTYVSEPVSMQVSPPFEIKAEEKPNLKPIKNIIHISSFWVDALPYLIIIAVCMLIALAWFIFKKYKREQLEEKIKIPPEETAFEALRKLKEAYSTGNEAIKPYYFQLSLITRQYIENIRNFPAAELTTDEISAHVKEDKDLTMLKFLRKADGVKFADDRPTTSEREEHWKLVWKYIKETSDEIRGVEENGDNM